MFYLGKFLKFLEHDQAVDVYMSSGRLAFAGEAHEANDMKDKDYYHNCSIKSVVARGSIIIVYLNQ